MQTVYTIAAYIRSDSNTTYDIEYIESKTLLMNPAVCRKAEYAVNERIHDNH